MTNRQERALCAVFTQAEVERTTVFEHVKQTGALPSEAYVFSIFDTNDEDTGDDDSERFVEVDVGPIRTLDNCQRLEAVVRAEHVPTRSCQRWTPAFALGLIRFE
jgi:hypothetical protein